MSDSIDITSFLRMALAEDLGDGDHTSLSTIPQNAQGAAKLLVKESGILAGLEIAKQVFQLIDERLVFEKVIEDGSEIKSGDIAFCLRGSSRSITMGERLALNIMQRMSGIATKTNRIQSLIADTRCKLLDTRKTTPGFRYFEKLAVKIGGGVNHRIGGGVNHRFGLYDMIMVKDNHSVFSGGITAALDNVKKYLADTGRNLKVEVEARNLNEVKEILQSDIAFRIMLDNFDLVRLKEAVGFINGRVETEASGGITESNVREYALCGVDYISMGALTHQINSLDLSLKAM